MISNRSSILATFVQRTGGVLLRALTAALAMALISSATKAQTVTQPPSPENLLVLEIGFDYPSDDPSARPARTGVVVIELLPGVAPQHVARIRELADGGFYDGAPFHRVIDGFMAQTGDPVNGDGTGGSTLPDLPAEFSSTPFERGVVGMARTQDPNSANSQFFIMFDRVQSLDYNYTVFGRVIEGMEFIDEIKRGSRRLNGEVAAPRDRIFRIRTQAALDAEQG